MASIYRSKGRRFWYAHFLDCNGYQHSLSTKTENQDEAVKIAWELERDWKNGKRTRVISPHESGAKEPDGIRQEEPFKCSGRTRVKGDIGSMVEHFRSECPFVGINEVLIYRWIQPAVVSGVYFLVHRGVVVYIGKASNVHSRGCDHLRIANKVFDSIYFIKVDPEGIGQVEDWFLARYKTKYNGRPEGRTFTDLKNCPEAMLERIFRDHEVSGESQ